MKKRRKNRNPNSRRKARDKHALASLRIESPVRECLLFKAKAVAKKKKPHSITSDAPPLKGEKDETKEINKSP